MRIHQERDERSPHFGEHNIYENPEEYTEKTGMVCKVWGKDDIEQLQIGEWVRADDGYVIQILGLRRVGNKTGGDTFFVRVPMGTFPVYLTKKGWKWRQLYAQFSSPHKGSISQRSRLYTGGHIEKIKFATLLVSGVNLTTAVRMTYPSLHRIPKNQLLIKAAKLMDDVIVREEIKNQVAKFKGDIIDKFGDVRLVKELDELLTHSKKGSDAHRGNIQLIMELRGLYEQSSKGKKLKGVQETTYTEVPPSEAVG